MVKLVRLDEKDTSVTDRKVFRLVVEIASRYGVLPSMSEDSEEFFINLLVHYTGELEDLAAWLEEQIPSHFVAVGKRPRWIQDPQWPFANGEPMVFAGQIDLSTHREGVVSEIFHDDTSLYVFVGRGVRPLVVLQQF